MLSSWRPLALFAALLLAAEASLGASSPPAVPPLVPAGAEVVLPPGTVWKARLASDGIVVAGRLIARGTAEKPIVFTGPKGWKGIAVTGEAIFEQTSIELAETGLAVPGGTVTLSSSSVTGCATGVDIDQSGSGDLTAVTFRENGRAVAVGLRARIAMRGCLVEQSREVGLFISRQAEGTVTGSSFIDNPLAVRLWQKTGTTLSNNLFRGNGKGIVADQTEAGPRLLSNVFSGNGTAALVVNGSSILIEGNLFAGNGTGVEANQVSVPELSGNTFSENKTAVSFLKRSRGRVVGNLFLNNGRALFCDYSSYPRVTGNNFEGKGMAVSLGENQSYDWETREGKHPTPLPGQPTPPPAFPVVDASGNWWGVATTAEMGSAGTDGNIAAIDDGLDHPSITYEGYAGRNYRMDKVVYRPFRREPVKDAGAPRDYLKGLRFPGAANPLAGK